MVQIVTEIDGPVFEVIEGLRAESVVTITGKVEPRAKDAINPNLPTGEVEIRAVEASVLSAAAELPLPVAGEQEYPEDVRLRYRFLDLRRETLHANIVKRTRVISDMRSEEHTSELQSLMRISYAVFCLKKKKKKNTHKHRYNKLYYHQLF